MRFLRALAWAPIRAYQRVVSPLLPSRCKYHPTCSEYAVQAIRTQGVLRGLVLAVKAYEHAVTEAAVSGSSLLARKAMLLYPPVGEWEPSQKLLEEMIDHNPTLAYLRPVAE